MNVSLAYQAYGQNEQNREALIVVHGLFGSGRNWHSLAKQWAEHYQVFSVDLRNHGQSAWADAMDYPAMAADLAAFLQARSLTSAYWLGHSMGGKAVMWLALQQPACVKRLVAVDIAPVNYPHGDGFVSYINAMQQIPVTTYKQRSEADAALAEAVPTLGIRQFLLQNLVAADGGFRWRLNLDALAKHLDTIVDFPATSATFDAPALFVGGAQSDYLDPAYHDSVYRLFPQARITLLAQAGHWVNVDAPQALLTQVNDFLSSPPK